MSNPYLGAALASLAFAALMDDEPTAAREPLRESLGILARRRDSDCGSGAVRTAACLLAADRPAAAARWLGAAERSLETRHDRDAAWLAMAEAHQALTAPIAGV